MVRNAQKEAMDEESGEVGIKQMWICEFVLNYFFSN